MDLVLTARMMDAQEAERAGLVSRVVPAAQLLQEAMAAGAAIAGFSLPAVMMAKEAVQRAFERRWRGPAVRAPSFPLVVRHCRPEGRHGSLRREAAAALRAR